MGIKWPQKWLLLFYYSNFYPDELVGTKIQKHSIPGNDLQERLVFEERGEEGASTTSKMLPLAQ